MTRATIAVALTLGLLAVGAAAAPVRDGAAIVDSGSTNTSGYRIDFWSDGTGVLTLQNRLGVAQGGPKTFKASAAVARRFFADVKAARDGKATGSPCMKSASFGTTTHVIWHGWTSPDLDCSADNPLTAALAHDVGAIRTASGVDTLSTLRRGFPGGPPHVEISPLPTTEP